MSTLLNQKSKRKLNPKFKKRNIKDYRRNQWNCKKGNQWGGEGQASNEKKALEKSIKPVSL